MAVKPGNLPPWNRSAYVSIVLWSQGPLPENKDAKASAGMLLIYFPAWEETIVNWDVGDYIDSWTLFAIQLDLTAKALTWSSTRLNAA